MTQQGTPVALAPDAVILALDAAGGSCSVALGRRVAAGVAGGVAPQVLAADKRDMHHGHASALVPMIEAVMYHAGLALAVVDAFAVGIGPGGFTGLRIALATARGLGLALRKPVIGISNFQAAAANLPAEVRGAGGNGAGDIVVLLDSRRSEPFAARLAPDLAFRALPILLDPAALAGFLEDSPPAVITGDGLGLWTRAWPPGSVIQPASADAIAVLGLAAEASGGFHLPARPSYLREPDVSLPKAS